MSKPEESLPETAQPLEESAAAPAEVEAAEVSPVVHEPVDAQGAEENVNDAHRDIDNELEATGHAVGDYAPENVTPDSAPVEASDKRPVRYAAVGLAVGVLVGFCFNFAVTGVQEIVKSSSATAISVAVADCNLEGRDGISVSDGNKHLSIDTKGTGENSGASTQNAICLVQALQVPENVLAKLNDTKPDGTSHKEEWDQREITWEFSADKGIKMEVLIKS